MTRLLLALAVLAPGAALAHPGAHLHPHGAEVPAWLLLAALAGAAAVFGLARGFRR